MATEDGDESSEPEGEKELKVHRLKVEVYDAETFEFKWEIQLSFGQKNNDWSYDPKDFFNKLIRNWEHISWSTNGKDLLVKYDQFAYFNLESGELQFYQSEPEGTETLIYDYLTNQFWNFTHDGVIGCFKQGYIEHFSISA